MFNNSLIGSLPYEVGDLVNLAELDVSGNKLSGDTPMTRSKCTSLLPEFLGKFRVRKLLNLSRNDFEGEMPREGIFTNASGVSIFGNVKPHSSQRPFSQRVVIVIACAFAFIIAMSCSIAIYSKVKMSRGSFGSLYKGVIPRDGTIVSVKVLNLQQQGSFKSFIDERKALRSIRHRNLLKILTACSGIDNLGNEFRSLVFKYMENGSLDSWLYPRDEEQWKIKTLGVVQRMNIAIDVASALDYLHHHCEGAIVHCDLKPSNVLLDEDMVAHVGDFGVARFLLETSNDPSQSQTICQLG
ncbi:hypothetical protein PRUPE_7G044700 [Prunus persica]|uniref:Protein kinase domain-containing protein n=1 Tax=Prunus persica TaxID=3760 RepID=A0A251N6N9_PRUPE|nr:hypothetical protein PRUPE_7G044700 [Prunus persica]